MTVLEQITDKRRKLLADEKMNFSLKEVIKKTEDLSSSGYKPLNFLNEHSSASPFLIAEIKRSSPSKGIIREDFNLKDIALAYRSSGHVNAISVLTEPHYFGGRYEYIKTTKRIAAKPILMKDFIFDEYQICRGFLEGASAVLLIAAVLEDSEIKKLAGLASELNMEVLLETHTLSEYRRALNLDFELIGINNRDLKTFVTDIRTSIQILESEGKPGDKTIISESGINSKQDVALLRNKGLDGFLIGERFMKQDDIGTAIISLFG